MEALVAIGLAGNILTFIDFGSKLVRETLRQYQKIESAEDHDLTIICEELKKALDTLELSSTVPSQSAILTTQVSQPSPLVDVKDQCSAIGKELLAQLESIAHRTHTNRARRALDSVRNAWRRSRQTDNISKLSSRLYELRSQLQFSLIVELNHKVQRISSSVDIRHEDLLSAAHILTDEIAKNHGSFSQLNELGKTIIDNICNQRDALDNTTQILRDHHSQMFQKLEDLQRQIETLTSVVVQDSHLSREHDQSSLPWAERLMDTFHFRTMGYRERDVEHAEPGTFAWMFEEEKLYNISWGYHTPSDLRNWLCNGSNIFRIVGKPGSGKSTFMKFLIGHEHTLSSLRQWSGGLQVYVLKYFAFKAATPLERSLKGFLRTVIFQLLEQNPDICSSLDSLRREQRAAIRAYQSGETIERLWSTAELKAIWSALAGLPHRICIFLDGLDEMNDDEHSNSQLCAYLSQISALSNVKILLASRDLQSFDDVLKLQKFRMHDWTRDDMAKYAKAALLQSTPVHERGEEDVAGIKSLIKDILDAAEGVFIWAKTVIAVLLERVSKADSLQAMRERLSKLPTNIEALYETILAEVESEGFADEACRVAHIINIFASDRRTSPLSRIRAAIDYDPHDIAWLSRVLESGRKIAERQDSLFLRKLRSRGSHFFLVTDMKDHREVTFLHRTAFDFLSSKLVSQPHGSCAMNECNCRVSSLAAKAAELASVGLVDLVKDMRFRLWFSTLNPLTRVLLVDHDLKLQYCHLVHTCSEGWDPALMPHLAEDLSRAAYIPKLAGCLLYGFFVSYVPYLDSTHGSEVASLVSLLPKGYGLSIGATAAFNHALEEQHYINNTHLQDMKVDVVFFMFLVASLKQPAAQHLHLISEQSPIDALTSYYNLDWLSHGMTQASWHSLLRLILCFSRVTAPLFKTYVDDGDDGDVSPATQYNRNLITWHSMLCLHTIVSLIAKAGRHMPIPMTCSALEPYEEAVDSLLRFVAVEVNPHLQEGTAKFRLYKSLTFGDFSRALSFGDLGKTYSQRSLDLCLKLSDLAERAGWVEHHDIPPLFPAFHLRAYPVRSSEPRAFELTKEVNAQRKLDLADSINLTEVTGVSISSDYRVLIIVDFTKTSKQQEDVSTQS